MTGIRQRGLLLPRDSWTEALQQQVEILVGSEAPIERALRDVVEELIATRSLSNRQSAVELILTVACNEPLLEKMPAAQLGTLQEIIVSLGKPIATLLENTQLQRLFTAVAFEFDALVHWRNAHTQRAIAAWSLADRDISFATYANPALDSLFPNNKIRCFLRAGRGLLIPDALIAWASALDLELMVRTWRLTGCPAKSEDLLRQEVDRFESASEASLPAWLLWEGACLHAMLAHDLEPLLAIVQSGKPHRTLRGLVHFALWARNVPRQDFVAIALKAESIRRSLGPSFDRLLPHYSTYGALRIIEQIEDPNTPHDLAHRNVVRLIEQRDQLPDLEDELLCLGAAARACLHRGMQQQATALFGEVRELSFKLSGKGGDILNCLADFNANWGLVPTHQTAHIPATATADMAPLQTLTHSTVLRMWRMSGITAKWISVQLGKKALQSLHLPVARLTDQEKKIGDQVIKTLGTLKGPLMKLGQIAGYFAEVAPEFPILTQFARLQHDSRRIKAEVIIDVIRRELGAHPDHIFASFDTKPIASASISQVHHATMPDGRQVVVKVQYPFIEKTIRADLSVMRLIAPLLKARLPKLDIDAVLDVIRDSLLQECNFLQEAEAQDFCSAFFAGHPVIRIPRAVKGLTTRRVIVMDYAPGRRLRDFIAHSGQKERDAVGAAIFEFTFRMLYGTGRFYSDPHGGNYKIDNGQVWFLDFGCVCSFDDRTIGNLAAYAQTFLSPDAETNWIPSAEAYRRFAGMPPLGTPDGFDDLANHRIMCEAFALPWRLDREFTFSPEFVREETRLLTLGNRNIKLLQLPPTYVLFFRLIWGLHAVLGSLHASASWHALMRDILSTTRREEKVGSAS